MSYITQPTVPSTPSAPPPPPAAPSRTASTKSAASLPPGRYESAQRILSTQTFEQNHAIEYAHLHNADKETLRKEAERLEEERRRGRAKRQAFKELSLNNTRPHPRARSVDGNMSTVPRPLSLSRNKEDGRPGLGIKGGVGRASGSSRPSSITYRSSSGSHTGLVSSKPSERPKSSSADPHALEVLVEAITPSPSLANIRPEDKSRSRFSLDSAHTTDTRRSSYPTPGASSEENSFAQHSTYSWATSFSGETMELRQAARYIPSDPATETSEDSSPSLATPSREHERRKRIVAIAHTVRLLEGVGSRNAEDGEFLDILQGRFGTGAPTFRPRHASSPTKDLQSYVSSLSSRSVRDSYASSLHDLVLQQQGSRLMKERAWLRESSGSAGGTPWGGDFEPPSDFIASVPMRTHEIDSEESSPPFEFDDRGGSTGKGLRRVNDRHVARSRMPSTQPSHQEELLLQDEQGQAGSSTMWTNRHPSASAWWDSSAPVQDHSIGVDEETTLRDFRGGESVEVDTTTSAATLKWTQNRTHNALEPAIDPTIVATSPSIVHTNNPPTTTTCSTSDHSISCSTPPLPPQTPVQPTLPSKHTSNSQEMLREAETTRHSTADVSFSPSDQAFFDTILQTPLHRLSTPTLTMSSCNPLNKNLQQKSSRHSTTILTTFSRPRSQSMIVTRESRGGPNHRQVENQALPPLLPPLEPSVRPVQGTTTTTPVPPSDSLFLSPCPASMVSTPSSPPLYHLLTPRSPDRREPGEGLMLHDDLHLPPLPPLRHDEDSLTGSARLWLPLGYKKKKSKGSRIPVAAEMVRMSTMSPTVRTTTVGQSPVHQVAGLLPDQVDLPLPTGDHTPYPFRPSTLHARASSVTITSPTRMMTRRATTPPSIPMPRTPDTLQTTSEMAQQVEWSVSVPHPLPPSALPPTPTPALSQANATLDPSLSPREPVVQQAEWQGPAPSVHSATSASPPPRPPRRQTPAPPRSTSLRRHSGHSSFRRASLDSACLPSAPTLWDQGPHRVVREEEELPLSLPMPGLEARPLQVDRLADTSRPESVPHTTVAYRVREAGAGVVVPQLLSRSLPSTQESRRSKAPTVLFWMGFILPLLWIFGSFAGSKGDTRHDVEQVTHGQLVAPGAKQYPWYRSWAYHPDNYVEACRWASVTTLTACIIAGIVVGIVLAV